MDPVSFVARDFVDDESSLGDTDVDEGLDLEAIAVDPFPSCITMRTSGRRRRATSTVPSVERPSTMITSCSPSGRRGKTCGRFSASFSAGMTTLTLTDRIATAASMPRLMLRRVSRPERGLRANVRRRPRMWPNVC